MNNYELKNYKYKKSWLKNRGIGGTDAYAIINGVGKWEDSVDVYNRIVNGIDVKQTETSKAMENGRKAEDAIKELFLISHPNLEKKNTSGKYCLIQRTDYPEITCSPDTIVRDKNTNELGFVEIKYKTIYTHSERITNAYLDEIKEKEPQYYYQLVQYYVAMNKLKFGYIVVCFNKQHKNDNDKWEPDTLIIDNLKTYREYMQADIDMCETKLIDFIENNIRKKIKPITKVVGQKEEKIKWNNLSNIQIFNK